MSNLQIYATSAEQQFLSDVSRMSSRLRARFDGLLSRIGFGRDAAAEWPRRFTPLVRLYPSLQAEAFAGISPEATQRATLAHVYFLIFSVLDDRRRDGQIAMTPDEVEFTKWTFERGLDILGEVVLDENIEFLTGTIVERYELGHRKLNRSAQGNFPPSLAETRAIVVGRSYWGALAALALVSPQVEEPAQLVQIIDAFESLVWGIQWVDDLEDWRDDLKTGDDNLVLLSLDAGSYADTCPTPIARNVRLAGAILDQNAIENAIAHACSAFEFAERIQTSLGCSTLAGLIRERIGWLQDIARDAEKQCRSDVLAGSIVSAMSGPASHSDP